MKKKKINKFYTILGIVLFIICALIFLNKQNFIDTHFFKVSKEVTEKTKNFLFSPFISFTNKVTRFKDFNNILNENDKLVIENQELSIIKNKNDELEQELNELKDELSLKKIYVDYDLETASVINRNVDYWFNNITIDKGEKDKIEIGNAVVTINGLLGKVIATTKTSATVKLITAKDSDMKVSVLVSGKDKYHHGVIVNYSNGLLVVNGITNYDGVNINSRVLTSGMGTLPSGILVGYVSKIEEDSFNTSKILYVEPKQDMNNIRYVTVLKNK